MLAGKSNHSAYYRSAVAASARLRSYPELSPQRLQIRVVTAPIVAQLLPSEQLLSAKSLLAEHVRIGVDQHPSWSCSGLVVLTLGRQLHKPPPRRLDAGGVEVTTEEAPALCDGGERCRTAPAARVEDDFSRLGDLAHPVLDRLDCLLPLVVGPTFGASVPLGEVSVVDPPAGLESAGREEQHGPMASVDHKGVDLRVSAG